MDSPHSMVFTRISLSIVIVPSEALNKDIADIFHQNPLYQAIGGLSASTFAGLSTKASSTAETQIPQNLTEKCSLTEVKISMKSYSRWAVKTPHNNSFYSASTV